MQKYAYKTLLMLLKALVYLKRFVFWLFAIFGDVLLYLTGIFRNTIGFRFYKIKFQLQKYTGKWKIPRDNRLIELIGKRNVLQVIIFSVIFIVMIPHSNLYNRDTTKVPGRDTLLYKIVGPGDQDFGIEEVAVNFNTLTPKETNVWKQGSIQAQTGQNTNTTILTQQDIAGIATGGTAITKPNIISGASLPTENNTTIRTSIVIHTVETGDTIGQIAEKYDIDVITILWANNLTTRSYIKPGDQLKILPTSGLVHTIKKGDTVSKIAKTYNTDVDKIILFNKLKDDGSDISIGEDLIIPGGIKPQPVPIYVAPTPVRQYTQLSSISAPPASIETPAGSGYLWPAGSKIITQYYSWRHTAIDIGGKMATPIYASRAGTIITSQCGWNDGYGCYIKIDHGGGVQTLYAHNSQLLVSVGDYISQGQTIALMGNTGNVRGITGIHLHFEIRINGAQVNPLSYTR